MKISNPVYFEMIKLGLIKKKNLFVLFPRTRDKNINVLKDKNSEIIFLEKNVINKRNYTDKPNLNYLKNLKYKKKVLLRDDVRRYSMFKKIIKNKKILDYGCGWGGFLSLTNTITKINE